MCTIEKPFPDNCQCYADVFHGHTERNDRAIYQHVTAFFLFFYIFVHTCRSGRRPEKLTIKCVKTDLKIFIVYEKDNVLVMRETYGHIQTIEQ